MTQATFAGLLPERERTMHRVRAESYPSRRVVHEVLCPDCEGVYDPGNFCARCMDDGWIALEECSCWGCVVAWAKLCSVTPVAMAEQMDVNESCRCGCGEAPGTMLRHSAAVRCEDASCSTCRAGEPCR